MWKRRATLQSCIPAFVFSLALAAPAALTAADLPAETAAKRNAKLLAPITPWHLEVSDHGCRLARKFGTEEAPSLLSFEQNAPGHRFDLTMAGPDIGEVYGSGWTFLGMRSDREMYRANPLVGEFRDFGMALNFVGLSVATRSGQRNRRSGFIQPSIDPADAAEVQRVVLQRSTSIVSFETGNMKAAFEALNACSSDLIPTWGLSLEEHREYKPPVLSDGDLYFSRLKHEFAEKSGAEGHKALLRVRALVATDGTVSDCRFEYSLSTGGMQPDVCEDIRQMRFEPASDAVGKPIASFFAKSVVLSPYSPWTADAHGGRWEED